MTWAIVTIAERRAFADALLAHLGDAFVIVDHARDVQRSHARAWSEVCARGGDWVGVMQDDVILSDDFAARVAARLRDADARAIRVVSLYNHAHNDRYLERVDERWARVDLRRIGPIVSTVDATRQIRSAIPGEQAVLARHEVARHYAAFVEDNAALYRSFPRVHDGLLGLFFNAHLAGTPDLDTVAENHVYITLPNLVDHRADLASSLGDPRVRRSSSFHAGAR
ncbi:MAG: hypothetical protein E6J90_31325 [Deltaproteobacteria bacterium]|nr:MAG: hypothetical protein E6J91_46425 [Deltaproteobacteria bacterium]TMQ12429.1 MAG: hypothetical protein E6J90_31325 [Deltaproteobacteria bacterium]